MIPFVQQPSFSLGGVPLRPFGLVLAGSVLAGEWLFRRRLRGAGLDEQIGMSMAWYTLVVGFVGAHLFSLLAYFPEKAARNPWLVFKLWEDVSSFGGMLGAAAGAAGYLWLRQRSLTAATRWAYLDALAFVTPFGWAVGRIACTLAHDHPGTLTHFPLAISLATPAAQAYITAVYAAIGRALPPPGQLATLGFHDLGWYEFLYLSFIMAPLWLWLDARRPAWLARPGAWVVAFAALYAPMRLVLDTLRIADARYAGLTPGQYAAGFMLAAAGVIAIRRRLPGL